MTYDDALGIFWLFVLLGLWLLPVIIASVRKHRQLTPIILITVLASWTVIGWFVALVWSAASFNKEASAA